MSINVAIILAGCGYQDGSDTYETAFLIKALEQNGAVVHFFSIKKESIVFNHYDAKYVKDSRRVPIVEAARMANNQTIRDISELKVNEFDGLFIPGGFGLLTNYSNVLSIPWNQYRVNDTLVKIIKEFHQQDKVIGTVCAASIIVGFVLKDYGVKISLGKPDNSIYTLGEFLGLNNINVFSGEFNYDEENLIFSCPAFLCTKKTYIVCQGIEKMIKKAIEVHLNKKNINQKISN